MSVRILFSLCLCCFCTVVVAKGASDVSGNQRIALMNAAESGSLILNDGQDAFPGLLLGTDIETHVSGPVASVNYSQRFYNHSQGFVEGTYVFPLPENAAVHAMTIEIGDRRIEGEIKEKAIAKKVYEQAKRDGKRAALVQQRKPNLFSSSVANIAPGETVQITIKYSSVLDIAGQSFGLRIPMTVTPRYSSALKADSGDAGPVLSTDEIPSFSNIAKLSVTIDGQATLVDIASDSHGVQSQFVGGQYQVETHVPSVPMNKDFHLSWRLANGATTQNAFFHQEIDGEHYGLLMTVPPAAEQHHYDPSRELILVMDTSGSMAGESIRQAKLALLESLKHIGPNDRFNLVEFNSDTKTLFDRTVPATEANLATAKRFIRGLQAEGGTEMLEAIESALNMTGDTNFLRQVVFVTDGAISNENKLFAAIHQLLGRARLFTVGIGSAPNSHFMRKAADFGRGGFVHINRADEAAEQIADLTKKLEHPVLQNIEIELPHGVTSENWPAKVPDLFLDEPVLVAMKFDRFPSFLTVSGQGERVFSQRIETQHGDANSNVAILWARQKIDALMDQQIRNNAMDSERDEIVDIALNHKLLTQYTSFVAVDKTPVRSANAALTSGKVANLQASGSAYPNTALGSYRQLLLAALLLALISALMWVNARRNHTHVVKGV